MLAFPTLLPNLALLRIDLSLPIHDPVLIVALAFLLFLVAPLLFERMRVPGIIGLIVAGAIVGPHGTNLLDRSPTLVLLGTVGLLYLMFLVGLELDLHEFNRYRNRSVVFGTLSFLVPQLVGTGMGLAFGYSLPSSLLLGAVFASHTVLAYPIASRLGILKNLAVTTTLGGTILTEILALLVLAVVAGTSAGSVGPAFWLRLVGTLSIYVVAVLWGIPRLGRWFFRNVRNEATREFVFVMAVLFSVAWTAHLAGVEPIIGALLAGLALNRLVPEHGPLMNRINFVGGSIFIPFFLLSVGMLVDVRALASPDAWTVAVAVAVGVVLSKWIASRATERVFGYTRDEGWVVFGLSVPHASGTLAIVLVGFEIGLFDQREVNGVVLTILVTSLIGPWVLERFGRRVALQEERKPYEPSEAPQRIMIPISNPATEEALLDLAVLVRGPGSGQPLYPLTVVRPDAERTEAQVAEAERMLSHAVLYAAGAEVPVTPLTRVDQNIASGIARGAAETRTTTIIIGWDGGRSRGPDLFGSVLNQLLDQTQQLVLVARLTHPLNTTKRLILVLPPAVTHHPGFYEAARTVKVIAGQLGTVLLGLVVADPPAFLRKALLPIRPEVPLELDGVRGWKSLLPTLREHLREDDLVVVMSARRGSLGWHRDLDRLPESLAQLDPGSFLFVHPSEMEASPREILPTPRFSGALYPERILFDLPQVAYPEALRRLVSSALGGDGRLVRTITDSLVERQEEFSTEVRPGVIVPHARVRGLSRPVVALGISPEGIAFPRINTPARLIFLLLSPVEKPEEHLRALSEIAQMVSSEERVQELVDGRDSGELPLSLVSDPP